MPYQALLEELVRSVPGAEGALMLDSLGEVVVEAGVRDDRHRLIGAYQGIALLIAQKTSTRYAAGEVSHIVCRYSGGSLILRTLKDGYYLVVALQPNAPLARAMHRSALAQAGMNAALE
jgi:predicted regulator of Ras-like GTPase activity (Roadblock/LC7/MglB family)